jgi:hypothetical protein
MEEMIEENLKNVMSWLESLENESYIDDDKIIERFRNADIEWRAYTIREDVPRDTPYPEGHLIISRALGIALMDYRPGRPAWEWIDIQDIYNDLYRCLDIYRDSELMKKNLNDYEMKKIRTDFE